ILPTPRRLVTWKKTAFRRRQAILEGSSYEEIVSQPQDFRSTTSMPPQVKRLPWMPDLRRQIIPSGGRHRMPRPWAAIVTSRWDFRGLLEKTRGFLNIIVSGEAFPFTAAL